MLADKTHDTRAIREHLRRPDTMQRRTNRFKQWRSLASRYDKTTQSYLGSGAGTASRPCRAGRFSGRPRARRRPRSSGSS
nr:hypothetical protein GCM10020241_37950 [Streptoalloteichus tenebrarius]